MLQSYLEKLVTAKRLAESDPKNSQLQRDLAANCEKIGELQIARGEYTATLEGYRTSLSIFRPLTEREPENLRWQHDLVLSYIKVGDVQHAPGEKTTALRIYETTLGIAQRLERSGCQGLDKTIPLINGRITDLQRALQDKTIGATLRIQSVDTTRCWRRTGG
jgi:hypothetical protein